MATKTEHSPAVCLRLITNLSQTLDHHCSLCLFFHGSDGACDHRQPQQQSQIKRSATPFSDCSFYTARTSDSVASFSSDSSSSTIRAMTPKPMLHRQPSLRRKNSPTEVSLRDLRARHAEQTLLRAKQSEEHLQHVYQSQILAYLEGSFASLDDIEE